VIALKPAESAVLGGATGGQIAEHPLVLLQVEVPGAARSASKTYTVLCAALTNPGLPLSVAVMSVAVPAGTVGVGAGAAAADGIAVALGGAGVAGAPGAAGGIEAVAGSEPTVGPTGLTLPPPLHDASGTAERTKAKTSLLIRRR
jgi:hypothetical protein